MAGYILVYTDGSSEYVATVGWGGGGATLPMGGSKHHISHPTPDKPLTNPFQARVAHGEGTQCISQLRKSLMPPVCEDGGQVLGDGNVLSQTMCLKRRTILKIG